MKKKTKIILAVVLLLVLAAAVYVGMRFAKRGTDITGVTTLSDRNTVYVNGKQSGSFASGSGWITVGEGEEIVLTYDFSAGSIDVFYRPDENAASAIADVQDFRPEDLPTAEEMTGEGSYGQEGITGRGTLKYPADPGTYTVYVVNHDAIGSATVTAKKG